LGGRANGCDAQLPATACIFGAYGKERNKNMWPSMNWRRMGEGSYWDRRIYSPLDQVAARSAGLGFRAAVKTADPSGAVTAGWPLAGIGEFIRRAFSLPRGARDFFPCGD
jgi:hypothetical protein